jgi:hypothetical protein
MLENALVAKALPISGLVPEEASRGLDRDLVAADWYSSWSSG